MTKHTPTKAEIMDSYRRGRVWATPNGGRTYASEFERWYKKVIAAAEQRGAERGWDEGYKSGLDTGLIIGEITHGIMPGPIPGPEANPYRADQMEGDDE